MKYGDIHTGKFLSRPNRFIAHVEIDGAEEICHVKNTGRCRELLIPGCRVFCEKSSNPARKTKYDLIAVMKGGRLINMDSQAPNKAAGEAADRLFGGVVSVRPEYAYGSSRIDFYIETKSERILMEVKGVTLEEDGVVMFPDAPTERGIKHLKELSAAAADGYRACILFVIQMNGVRYFTPNRRTHPQFAEALKQAAESGVEILAYDTVATENSMEINEAVEVRV
ncbi:MAG: DNA/RNA nuclease SfsA [Oscillospiraceae bacterium]